jgi:hypothetical protein
MKVSRLSQALAGAVEAIPYRPDLRGIAGSVTGAILLQQIVYWHSKKGGPFFKFKTPPAPGTEGYRPGDSWTEELGFSRHEFDTALAKIGQKIGKKTQRDPAALVWFWTGMDRRTWYQLNEQALAEAWEAANSEKSANTAPQHEKPESGFTKSRNPDLHKAGIRIYEKPESGFIYKEQRLTSETNTEREDGASPFLRFLALYGVADNQPLSAAWYRHARGEAATAILAHLPGYLARTAAPGTANDKQYRKSPLNYLRDHTWENDPNPAPAPSTRPAAMLPIDQLIR